MSRKKSSVLLVPPQGSRIKAIRVRWWMAAFLIVMVAIGVFGFLVPVDRLILTEREQDQKNLLKDQNARLHQNIGTTLKVLSGLKEQTAKLQEKKEQSSEMIGLPLPQPARAAKPPEKSVTVTPVGTAELLRRLEEQERFTAGLVARFEDGRHNMFDTVPVGYPVSLEQAIISKRYGIARDPFTGRQKPHYGTDFAAEIGTPVVATAAGAVTLVENDPVWGRRVVITHGGGLRTVYAHLGAVTAAHGKTVARGEVIGTVGISGLTTGPHVHYELWRGNEQLNPEHYFFPNGPAASRQ